MDIIGIIMCSFIVGAITLVLLGIFVATIIDLYKAMGIKNALIYLGIIVLFCIVAIAIGYLIVFVS